MHANKCFASFYPAVSVCVNVSVSVSADVWKRVCEQYVNASFISGPLKLKRNSEADGGHWASQSVAGLSSFGLSFEKFVSQSGSFALSG